MGRIGAGAPSGRRSASSLTSNHSPPVTTVLRDLAKYAANEAGEDTPRGGAW